jgi:hypothetical protein
MIQIQNRDPNPIPMKIIPLLPAGLCGLALAVSG